MARDGDERSLSPQYQYIARPIPVCLLSTTPTEYTIAIGYVCGKGNATTFRRLRYCRAVLSVPGDGGGGALPRPRVAYGPWRVAALASGAECGGGRQAGSGAGERASSPGDLECKTRAILIHPCAVARGGMGRGAGASSAGVRRKRETAFPGPGLASARDRGMCQRAEAIR